MLPDLSEPFPLPGDDVAAYRRDGHVTVSGLASAAEIAAYRPALLEAAAAAPQMPKPPRRKTK